MSQYNFVKPNSPKKLIRELKISPIAGAFDSLVTAGDEICVLTNRILSSGEESSLNSVISAHSTGVSAEDAINNSIQRSSDFAKLLMLDFSIENVLMGITQQNKTKDVLVFLRDLKQAMDTGSLYAAIQIIDGLIAAGLPPELSPFITETRLNNFKQRIVTFLAG